jgi:hypothetical protein
MDNSSGAGLENADYWHIAGHDLAGEWSYAPIGGLLPIDIYELRLILTDKPD